MAFNLYQTDIHLFGISGSLLFGADTKDSEFAQIYMMTVEYEERDVEFLNKGRLMKLGIKKIINVRAHTFYYYNYANICQNNYAEVKCRYG